MKHSEFWWAVGQAFGTGYGRSVTEDLVLTGVGGRTAVQALAEGIPPRQVWDALCDEMDVDDATRWVHRRAPRDRRGNR